MPYLYIFIAITILFIVLHKLTQLSMRQKSITTISIALLVSIFFIFEQSNSSSAKKAQSLRFAFEQGQILICDDVEVTNKLYNYISRSFIGKKGIKAFGSRNIAISECQKK